MTWLRIDDGFAEHPKVVGLSADALRLWIRAACWCSGPQQKGRRPSVDGFVPASELATIARLPAAKARKLAAELVAATAGGTFALGLWEPVDGGWLFHDWHKYGAPPGLSERRAEAGRHGAAKRWGKQEPPPDDGNNDGKCHGPTMASAMANGRQADAPYPIPDQIPPTTPIQDLSGRGAPLPSAPSSVEQRDLPLGLNWRPHPATVADLAKALRVGEPVIIAAAAEFLAYWTIGGGAGRAKANWHAAFREHCRRSAEQGKLGPAKPAADPLDGWSTG